MPIDYQALKRRVFKDVEQTYTWKDSALYALGVGYAERSTATYRYYWTQNFGG